MISAKDLKDVKFEHEENGYSKEQVNSMLNEAAQTVEAYANENAELYRKLEVLAGKVEEYRKDEDSIKSALITAQKMSDQIEFAAKDKAAKLTEESEQSAAATVAQAKDTAEKTVSEARAYASNLIKSKTEEANTVIAEAEKKANDAINSSKIVAKDILDQAKAISEDLISSSKEEKEAYELLNSALKKDASDFIEKLKELYSAQLEALNGAKLDMGDSAANQPDVEDVENRVSSLLDEIDDMKDSIPDGISIDAVEAPAEEPVEEPAFVPEEPAYEEAPAAEPSFVSEEPEQLTLTEEEPVDTRSAVEAFSHDEITPVDTSVNIIPEINDEPEMEDAPEADGQPFESYFNLKKEDAHLDKTQTISLVPPDDYDDGEDDEPKHKAFFKKKK